MNELEETFIYSLGLIRGTLHARGNLPVIKKEKFGLNIGDIVAKIGTPGRNGGETSSNRIFEPGQTFVYEGTFKEPSGDDYMAFSYHAAGEKIFMLFKFIEEPGALLLADEISCSVLIYKTVFEVQKERHEERIH